ncbi:Allantoin permease [Exophiala dermatitidis]
MGHRESFWGVPLPNFPQWKQNFRLIWKAPTLRDKLHVTHKLVQLDTEKSIFSNGTLDGNRDLDPVPPEQRTWRAWDFMTYWASDQFTFATWGFGSTMVAQGFTLREIVPLTFFGMVLTGTVCALSGYVGSDYRIGFPVSSRLSWGVRMSWFPVLVRAFMALMWLGILNINLAQAFHQMFRAIWPEFDNIPNALPADAGITSADLLCYFILLIIQTPLTMIPIYKLKWFFLFKAVLSPFVFFGSMIWAFVVTKDGGVLVTQSAHLTGTEWEKHWERVKAFGYAAGFFSTVCTNIPDFARFAKTSRGLWMQALALPLTGVIPVICATITSSATIQLYGESYWSPTLILAQWHNRAAVFFAAVIWIIANIGVNLSANTVTVAIALSSFAPKYINNIRGAWLVALLSIIIVPWKIVNDGGSFYNFLGAYPPLLGPISGILMSDYWLVRRGRIDVRHLYIGKGGKFWFFYGCNWRAIVAYLAAYAPNLPGFIHQVSPNIPNVQPYTYDLNWVFAVIVAAVVFWALNWAVPPRYSLSGGSVHPDDVIDWSTGTRIGDWEGIDDSVVVGVPEVETETSVKHQTQSAAGEVKDGSESA